MKKKVIISLSIIAILAIVLGIFLSKKNKELKENQIKIMDATIVCKETVEKFHEDDKYIYSFPCTKSNSVYVKLSDGNKMLITNALEEKKVTIDELIDAGLEVIKTKK